jgi:hypothetical protein
MKDVLITLLCDNDKNDFILLIYVLKTKIKNVIDSRISDWRASVRERAEQAAVLLVSNELNESTLWRVGCKSKL